MVEAVFICNAICELHTVTYSHLVFSETGLTLAILLIVLGGHSFQLRILFVAAIKLLLVIALHETTLGLHYPLSAYIIVHH